MHNRSITFSLLTVALLATGAYLPHRRNAFRAPAGGGGTLWISQATDNDNWDTSADNFSQLIKNTVGSVTITKVIVRFKTQAGTSTATAALWTGSDTTGSQWGADSIVTNINTSYTDYEFTWLSNPVVTSGDFYLSINISVPVTMKTSTVAGGTGYENNVYASYRGGAIMQTGDSDLVFSIYKL